MGMGIREGKEEGGGMGRGCGEKGRGRGRCPVDYGGKIQGSFYQ